MKIGIFVSNRDPREGGGYTITYDILNSLIKKICINKIDNFHFILVNDKNNYIKSKLILKKIKFSEFNENIFLLNIKNIIFSISPFLLSIIRFFNLDKFYKLEKINKLDIVWYLSAEYSYPKFRNYISTVWDLMHITDSNFPEVGNFFIRTYRSIVIKNFLKNSKKIITGSNYIINILKKNYQIKSNQIIKASHPTPSDFLCVKKGKLNNKINKFFLYPANFWDHKNHLNLVAGFNLFNIDEKFKYNLVLVGDIKNINYYNKLLNLISSTESKNNIFILNFVSRKKLINLYDSCKSLVYSSYCGPENLPPLEAFARNKPVLCSMYRGAKEQLGNLPIYFKSNNILSISRSFKTIVNGIDKKKYNYNKFAQSKSTEKYINEILNNIYSYIETKPNIFVLGLNAGTHGDSSACLVKNGRLIAAAEEEKFVRIKHCSNFPKNSIKYCLRVNNINMNNVNYIAINGNSSVNFLSKASFFLKNLHNISYILSKTKFNINNKNTDIKTNFKLHFNTDVSKKIYKVRHHLSHVFSTFFFIKKDINSLIYSFDGSGDFSTIEVYLGNQSKYKLIEKTVFPNSLGFFYTAFTQFLGFRSYGDEYKVMGLSGYGRPIYTKLIRKLFRSLFPFKLNMKYFNLPEVIIEDNKAPKTNIIYSKKFIDLLGNPRRSEAKDIEQIYKDYAASMQKVFEDAVLMHLKRLKKRYRSKKLYITGGCAYNGLLVGKIIEAGLFESVSVGNNPGDAGGAIGSAFFLLQIKNEKIDPIQNTTFLGPGYNNEYIKKNIIDKIQEQNKYNIKFYENFDDLVAKAALIIKKEKIIFWFQDNMEWGPRALGNRSILADPSSKNIKNLLNSKIKKRELFRPFAPAVMEEFASDYFYMNNHKSPFMNIVFKARENTKNSFPGIVHVDGTSRVQTVSESDNKKFYKLLQEFNKISNCPILINTSLNINEPIALTPSDAFKFFLEAEVKCIVLNNWIIELKR